MAARAAGADPGRPSPNAPFRVLITRPRQAAERTARQVAALGLHPLILPLTEIVALRPPIAARSDETILATSANALAGLEADGLAAMSGRPLIAVGDATAEAARRAGFRSVRTGPGDAERLAAELTAPGTEKARFLYLAGRLRRPLLEERLAAAGHSIRTVETYDTQNRKKPALLSELAAHEPPDAVLVMSVAAAEILAELIEAGTALPAGIDHICLSPRIAEALGRAGEEAVRAGALHISEAPNEEKLLQKLAERAHAPRRA